MQKTNAKTIQVNLGQLTLTEKGESKGGRPTLISGKITKPEGDYYVTFYAGPKPEASKAPAKAPKAQAIDANAILAQLAAMLQAK